MGMLSAEDVEMAVYEKTKELQARIAELEQQLEQAEAQNEALRQQLQNFMTTELTTAVDYASSFILRKQAEAVEEITEADPDGRTDSGEVLVKISEIWDYAQRLRDQADKLTNSRNDQ